MSASQEDKAIPMHAEYYLFGVYFIAEVDSETNKKTFPNWHAETSLIDNQDITNVRPLARVPMINITDSDDLQLWAARHDFKLSKLNSGQPTDTGVFEALKPESPIHTLGSSIANNPTKKYTFRFPPLSWS